MTPGSSARKGCNYSRRVADTGIPRLHALARLVIVLELNRVLSLAALEHLQIGQQKQEGNQCQFPSLLFLRLSFAHGKGQNYHSGVCSISVSVRQLTFSKMLIAWRPQMVLRYCAWYAENVLGSP